jgi:hypothetical protein
MKGINDDKTFATLQAFFPESFFGFLQVFGVIVGQV